MSARRQTGWHLPAAALEHYSRSAGGELDGAWACSVEAHLDSCAECRRRLTPVDEVLGRIGTTLSERIGHTPQYRRPRWYRIGLTAGLPVTWLLGVLVVTVMASAFDTVSQATDGSGTSVLLLLAPVLPLIAVAAVWNPRLDPLHELSAGTPSAGLALLLRRTLLTLFAVVLASLAVSLLGGRAPATQWLLPALALTAVSLALGSRIRLHLAASIVVGGWAAAVVLPALSRGHVPIVLETSAAPAWAAVLVLAVICITLQRDSYQRFSPTS